MGRCVLRASVGSQKLYISFLQMFVRAEGAPAYKGERWELYMSAHILKVMLVWGQCATRGVVPFHSLKSSQKFSFNRFPSLNLSWTLRNGAVCYTIWYTRPVFLYIFIAD